MLERTRLALASLMMPRVGGDNAPVQRELSPNDIGQAIISGMSSNSVTSGRSRKELLDAYNWSPWLRSAVHKVAYSTAMTTWRLFVAKDAAGRATMLRRLQTAKSHEARRRIMADAVRRKEAEFEELDTHPLLEILNTGNDLLPGTVGSQIVQMHVDLTGEAFELKERGALSNARSGRSVVERLLPIPPSWVMSLPTPTHPFYEVRFGSTGSATPVRQEDIIMYRDPNPLSPFGRGSGAAGALADQLQSNRATVQTIRTRLERNAIPPFIAMPEASDSGGIPGRGPSREQINSIREEWERRLSGPQKGGGFVHFLKRRFKFEKLGSSFEELSLIPLLKNQRDTIIQVYGLPPEILGIIENSNRATISAAELLFARHVLVPRLEMRRAVLQHSLVAEFDDRLILDYDSPVPEDDEAQREVMNNHSWAFQADEIRARAGELPLEDEVAGASHAVPSSVFIEPSLSGAAESDDDEPEDEPEPDDDDDPPLPPSFGQGLFVIDGARQVKEVPGDKVPLGLVDKARGRDATYWWLVVRNGDRLYTRDLGVTSPTRANDLARRLVAQAPGTQAAVCHSVASRGGYIACLPVSVFPSAKQLSNAQLNEVLDDIDEQVLADNTMPAFREGLEAAGQQRLEELGLQPNFDLNDPKVIAFLAEESSSQIKRINDTTRSRVRATLSAGMQEGEGVNELARRVRTEMAEAAGRRSVVIARTESVRALNAGSVAASAQAGMEGKQWLSTRDLKVRDSHVSLDGQVRRVDGNFNSPLTGAAGPHPGALGMPEEDCNCRCTTLSVPRVGPEDETSLDAGDSVVWPPYADTEEKRVRIWKAAERQRKPIEKSLLRAYRRGFAKQEKAVINSLRSLET